MKATERRADAPAAALVLVELQDRLGGIPLERIQLDPTPGTATEADLIARQKRDGGLLELVDGTLVEKAVAFYEARLATVLSRLLDSYVEKHDLGITVGPDADMRLAPGLVRLPDVAFLAWKRFPHKKLPRSPVPDIAPDLAVEVLSRGNTKKEIERKLPEYFTAGTRLAWVADPKTRTVKVYASPETVTVVTEDGVLAGGDVLPGFRLSVREWFTRAGEQADS